MESGQVADITISEIAFTMRVMSEEELDQVNQLTESVRAQGLLHPLTVEYVDTPDKSGYVLKAGLKRLLACRNNGHEVVPCLVLPDAMTEEQKKETHLHENLFRFNLPWWEQVLLKKELLELRQAQRGVGRSGRKVGFSLRDLADELKQGLGTLSEDMRLAEAVIANPSLRGITDKITAKRLIFAQSKREDAEVEASMSTTIDFNTTYFGNSAEILKHFPDNSFDVCVTDPPWLEFREARLTKDDQTLPVFKQLYRLLKPEAFLYAFVSTPDFIFYQQELPKFGFKVQQMPLIWVKQNHISHGLRSYEYARDYEPILLAVKGTPVLTNTGQLTSIFTYPLVHPSRAIHPNEKPIELIKHILGQCTYDGSLVIEPFGGSGVTAQACNEMGRRWVLCEREKDIYDKIVKRLAKVEEAKV